MNEGARYCGYCDKPLLPGQQTTKFVTVAISAGGWSMELHDECVVEADEERARRLEEA
ncbi:hypothetical protein [Streptomyces sp. NPDC006552]|uniref:hypothetical protein n=1 Tax=Streptomyces sp. NPDC006552 TaxID=3157179 RepID=UPI0033A2A076